MIPSTDCRNKSEAYFRTRDSKYFEGEEDTEGGDTFPEDTHPEQSHEEQAPISSAVTPSDARLQPRRRGAAIIAADAKTAQRRGSVIVATTAHATQRRGSVVSVGKGRSGTVSIGFQVEKTKETLRRASVSGDLHAMQAALTSASVLAGEGELDMGEAMALAIESVAVRDREQQIP